MAKALLIAEKPALMRDVQSAYKNNKSQIKDTIEFASFAGHTMSLKNPGEINSEWEKWSLDTLPRIPDKFEYKVSSDKKKMYNDIKKQIKNGEYDYLINCCDPGREGQAIFHTFYESLNISLPVKRMWHSDLTEDELVRALTNLRDDLNEPALYNMTEASKLRAYFDWLIGMNYSPAYTLIANTGKAIGIGRVMTPTLAILVNRELEIANFTPKDFYELEATFDGYSGIYYRIVDGKEVSRLDSEADVEKIKKSLSLEEKKSTIVMSEKKRVAKYAPKLHNLAEIQSEANRAFKYTPKKTLELVQSLYEKKLLSYPRTDSNHLTVAMTKDFEKMLGCLKAVPNLGVYVDKILGEKSRLATVSNDKRYVDNSKVTDHYAITPTGKIADLSKLPDDEVNIYTLVAKRFLSIFLDPQVTEKSILVTENNSHLFKTNGTILIDKGYTVLYDTNVANKMLPNLKDGDKTTLKNSKIMSKKTSPPPRYDDGSLVEIMANVGKLVEDKELKEVLKEAKGIGTSATRADIIEKLVKTKTIERKGKAKQIYATEYGISIIEGLRGQDIISAELTAVWENKLSEIEKCNYDPKKFYSEMINYIENKTKEMMTMTVNIEGANAQQNKKAIGTCPKCKKHSVIEGSKGFGCSGYKEGCDFVIWKSQFGGEINAKNAKLLVEGLETEPIKFHSKAKNTDYNAKLKLKDDFSTELVFDNTPKTSSATAKPIAKCPCCGKDIVENSKAFGCTGWKEGCKFTIWKESNFYKDKKISKNEIKKLLNGECIFENLKLNDKYELEYVKK